MFGLGRTQVSPVSANVCSRLHPLTGMTVSSSSRPPASAGRNSRVEEPGQLADRHAVLLDDLLLAHAGGEAGSQHRARARAPPTGLGRSSTTNRAPVATAAFIAAYIVQT